jgi:5-methylcytosine-specific restriction protein A
MPGCPAIIAPPARYCPAHTSQAGQYDRDRGNAQERGYDRLWQKLRKWFLGYYPLCGDHPAESYPAGQFVVAARAPAASGRLTDSYCRRDGRITAATVVDHIYDHRGNQEIFWDPRNRAALCASCHNRKPPRAMPNTKQQPQMNADEHR